MIYIKKENDLSMYSKQHKDLSLHYLSSGSIVSNNHWKHRQRLSDCYELLFVIRGNLHIQEEETRYTLSENHYIILQPYKLSFGFQPSKGEVAFYWLQFQTSDLKEWGITSFFSCCDEPLELTLLLEKIAKVPITGSNTADLYAALVLNELAAAQNNNLTIQPIMHWIKANISGALDIETVANNFGYNKDYLSKLFNHQCGQGIKKYINSELIKRAKTLLLTSSYSISQISDMLLFPTPNLFNKFFKYHEKISPLDRKSVV